MCYITRPLAEDADSAPIDLRAIRSDCVHAARQLSFSRLSLERCQLPITMLRSNRISHLVPWWWVQVGSCSSPIPQPQQRGARDRQLHHCDPRLHSVSVAHSSVPLSRHHYHIPPVEEHLQIAVATAGQVQLLTIAGPGSPASPSSSSGGR